MYGKVDLEKSLLDVERKHGISLELADWETRQPPTAVKIDTDNRYATNRSRSVSFQRSGGSSPPKAMSKKVKRCRIV